MASKLDHFIYKSHNNAFLSYKMVHPSGYSISGLVIKWSATLFLTIDIYTQFLNGKTSQDYFIHKKTYLKGLGLSYHLKTGLEKGW
jgi:hypothetical protein